MPANNISNMYPDNPSVFWNDRHELIKDGVVIGRVNEGFEAFYNPNGEPGEEFQVLPKNPSRDAFPDLESAKRSVELLGKISLESDQ